MVYTGQRFCVIPLKWRLYERNKTRYNARRVALKFTNDLDITSIRDYYQIRDAIESMLKMLHEYSNVMACSVDITVYVSNYK